MRFGRSLRGVAVCVALAMLMILASAVGTVAAPGDLDASFGTAGVAQVDGGHAYDMALDSQGRVIVAGLHNQTPGELIVARFTPAGQPDTSFGGGDGIVITGPFEGGFSVRAIGVDSSDRIYVGGTLFDVSQTNSMFGVARFTTSGELDTTYGGGDGVAAADFTAASARAELFRDMAVTSTGTAVACGHAVRTSDSTPVVALSRLTDTGSLDATFSGEGLVVWRDSLYREAFSCALNPVGPIVVGDTGYAHVFTSSGEYVSTTTIPGMGNVNDFAFTPDQSPAMILVGQDGSITTHPNLVVRMGSGAVIDIDVGSSAAAKDVAVQADGKIVVSGISINSSTGEITLVVARLNPDASPDTSFGGGDGIVFLNPGSAGSVHADEAAGLAIQPDGKIVLGAHISVLASTWEGMIGALRLAGDTPPDSTGPTISYALTGTLGNNGWYVSDVTVDWTVTDPESSVTIDSGCVDTTLTTDTAGTTYSCQATSAGGTSSRSVTVKRDTVPPAQTGLGADAQAVYWLNGGGTFSVLFADTLSGPSNGTATTSIDTSSVGTKQVQIPMTDNAGNVSTYSSSVRVAYVVTLDPPLQAGNVYNRVKAGKLVPWRFTVRDANGVPINDVTLVSQADAGGRACDPSYGVNVVSEVARGKAGLIFLGNGAYEYRYKFPRGSTGSCLKLALQLGQDTVRFDSYERWTYFEVVR